MARGFFLSFEGGEGTGKTTQLTRLAARLSARGVPVVSTREPGGTPLAEAVRAILLDPGQQPDGWCELFLLSAARRDHVQRVIRPALDDGAIVLCDRFADSSTVYQGVARGLGTAEVIVVNRYATASLAPDLTLVFDLDPRVGLARARTRNQNGNSSESRLDDEPVDFHRRVREGFQWLAAEFPERVRLIDATGSEDEVAARVVAALPEALR